MKFQAKITNRVRIVTTPFTASEMESEIGRPLLQHIIDRIRGGLNVYDAPAKPLAQGYRRFKVRRGGSGVRDLSLTRQTMNQVRVLSANPNGGVIGPIPGAVRRPYAKAQFYRPLAVSDVLRINNRRERQWGLSSADEKFLADLVDRKLTEKTRLRREDAA